MAYTKPESYDVVVENIEEIVLATVDHQGDYMTINQSFGKLFETGQKLGLLRDTTRMIGIYYDDPSLVPVEKLRSKAGFTLEGQDFQETAGISKTVIPAGRYGILTHQGPYETLKDPYNWLWEQWLPQSGEKCKTGIPCLEEYLNSPRDVAPEELLTKVYVPLEDRDR